MKFDQLTKKDMGGINRDFSALMSHTTVSPAGGLTKPGAFEFGLIAGTVSVPNVNRLVQRQDPNEEQAKLPNLGIVGLYSYAARTTFEAKWIPDMGSRADGASIGSQSLAVKFSFPDSFGSPLITALRVQLTNSYMRIQQDVNNASTGNMNVTTQTKFTSLSAGATLLAGYRILVLDLFLFEPYVGVGVIQGNARFAIEAASSASIFASGSSSESSAETGAILTVGAQAHLFYCKLGFEYSRVFDADKVTAKLSFGY